MTAKAENTVAERVREELRKYLVISLYLYVCFGVVLLYEASVAGPDAVTTLHYGSAAIKALVIGKFILIGEALSVGAKSQGHPLLHRVAWKSLAVLVLLVVFKILEELVVGWVHGERTGAIAAAFLERGWVATLAPTLLMLLILVPLVSASELYRSLGHERFRALLAER